jgi:hypothetical protein
MVLKWMMMTFGTFIGFRWVTDFFLGEYCCYRSQWGRFSSCEDVCLCLLCACLSIGLSSKVGCCLLLYFYFLFWKSYYSAELFCARNETHLNHLSIGANTKPILLFRTCLFFFYFHCPPHQRYSISDFSSFKFPSSWLKTYFPISFSISSLYPTLAHW